MEPEPVTQPPPEPEGPRKSGLNPAAIITGLLILMALGALVYPVVLKQKKAADRTKALSNIKQLGAMLIEFDTEYGRFPDDGTAREVKEQTKTDFTLTGQFSNDYFRQMVTGGGGKSEKPFWCKTPHTFRKVDDDFSTPAKCLEAGEVGYSYIMASPTQGQKASEEPSRPVIVAPPYQFRADWTFDPEPYAGKVVVLRLDNSATAMQIREDNRKVSTNSGKTLGDAGEQTPWGTKITPFLRAPQPRP